MSNTHSNGYAIVSGKKVTVMVGMTLREIMGETQRLNRCAPINPARVYRATYLYEGLGKISDIKLGKAIYMSAITNMSPHGNRHSI